jgi:hypothetical protein
MHYISLRAASFRFTLLAGPGEKAMQDSRDSKGKSFTAFRSASEEAETKREQQAWDNEGGHMSSTSGRIMHVPDRELPYVVLTHQGSEATEHSFATMREAEAFVKRNTPVPGRTLSPLYDRPPSDS